MIKRVGLVFALLLSASSFAGEVVDINTADAMVIAAEVKGIGPIKAKAIVEYREINGPYETIGDLVDVHGIGEKTFSKIRNYVKVSRE